MLIPCEVVVKTVGPAIRAFMAQNLIEKHDMNQLEAAKILGVSQSAISKYSKKVRGTTITLENVVQVQTLTDQMVTLLMTNPVQQIDVMRLFCKTCRLIRSQGMMCPLCQENQSPIIDGCNFCDRP